MWGAVVTAEPYLHKSFALHPRQIATPASHHVLQTGCSSWRQTNSVKALKAALWHTTDQNITVWTFVYAVKRGEDDDKERRGVFPGVHEMRKRQSCVAVTTQALRKTKPWRQCSHHGTYAVRHTSANSRTYNNACQMKRQQLRVYPRIISCGNCAYS